MLLQDIWMKKLSLKSVMVNHPKIKGTHSVIGLEVVVGNKLVVNMMVNPVQNNLVRRPNHIAAMQMIVQQ